MEGARGLMLGWLCEVEVEGSVVVGCVFWGV